MANQLQTKQSGPFTVQSLNTYLSSGIDQLAKSLLKNKDPERFIRMIITATYKTPKLLTCSGPSFVLSMMNASAMGLEFNGRDAYLVPYGDECQLIPGYQGYIQLAYRSPGVVGVSAKAVHANDEFDYSYGTDEHLIHIPNDAEDPGELTHAWAMVRFKGGGSKFVVLNKREVLKRKAASKSSGGADSPWKKWPEPMWAKSAVRELAKWMPQSAELIHALDVENLADLGLRQIAPGTPENQIFDVTPEQAGSSKSERLAQQTGATGEQPIKLSGGEMPMLPDLSGFETSLASAATAAAAQKMFDSQIVGHPDLTTEDVTVARLMLRDAKARIKGANNAA